MKLIFVLSACICLAQARRIVRQADGEFWWLNNNTNPVPEVSVVETGSNETRSYVPSSLDEPTNNGYDIVPQPPKSSCECVPYYLCNDGDIITDGSGLIDIRVGPTSGSSNITTRTSQQCESYLDVCCGKPTPEVTVPPITEYKPQCGRRNNDGVHVRITGSGYEPTNAQFGEFPWMAAVLRKENIGDKTLNLYICGGSLIKPNVILTAAHCVNQYLTYADGLLARLGEWNTQDTNEPYKHQDINVAKIVIHPEFNPSTLFNDFALLYLEYDAKLTSHVDTVCLPSSYDLDLTGQRCFATGWGKDEFGKEGSYQNVLKLIDLPFVDNSKCQYQLRQTRLGQYFNLDKSFMCAGGEPDKDACKGDGGSPLVCPIFKDEYGNPLYAQVGIVAWGIGCGENGVPGVYASVSNGLQWIEQNLGLGSTIDNSNPY